MGPSAEMLAKYPSLGKFDVMGDDYVESGDGREVEVLKFIYNHPQLASLRGNPGKVAAALEEFSFQHDFLISIGSDKARIVTDEIQKLKPKVFVECGGYVGYSTIVFADAQRRARPNEKVEFWSFEFDPLYASIAMNLIDLAGLGDVVKVVTGAADASLTRLKSEGKIDKVDMLFLDHVEELYAKELKAFEAAGVLKSGSCILADNVLRPGAPEYREYVRGNPNLTTRAEKGLIMPGEFEDEVDISMVK